MPEAQVLCGFAVEDDEAMQRAAQAIAQNTNGAVLIKGGHRSDTADDLLVLPDGSLSWLRAKRIDTENTHGTGCTLSSAIACGLAQGNTIEQAVRRAKGFVRGAMSTGLNLGQGNGPLNHMWCHGKPHLPYAQYLAFKRQNQRLPYNVTLGNPGDSQPYPVASSESADPK